MEIRLEARMRTFLSLAIAVGVYGCDSFKALSAGTVPKPAAEPAAKVVLQSELKWEDLNPARGDKSPKAATLWGDRNGSGATGFLLKPADGFESPPHIHNVSYRGVVIRGLIHNDDPGAERMWMPRASFWTQPRGEVHITAAKGRDTLAYIEIDEGPYLVLPSKEAFDSGERPVNLDKSNIVWLDASNTGWIKQSGLPASAEEPELAFLWGKPQNNESNGALVKLPAGFTGNIKSHGATFRAVVIKGQPRYQVSATEVATLQPGSYFSSEGESVHQVSSEAGEECIIYVRTEGAFDIMPAQPRE
jgi:hypothetical protein